MDSTEEFERWTLDEIDRNSLAASAFKAVGDEEFYGVKKVYKLIGLPIPEDDSFLSYENSDRSYLSKFGLVNTMLYRRRNLFLVAAEKLGLIDRARAPIFEAAFVKSDDVLQPLIMIPVTENAVLEINAGVRRVHQDGEKHIPVLRKKLNEQGLRLIGNTPEMVGVFNDPEAREQRVVLGNRRLIAAKPVGLIHNQSVGLIDDQDVNQARVFAELRHDFEQAMQSGRQELFTRAFNKCARIAALDDKDPEKILDSYWTNNPRTLRDQEIAHVARKYGRQLEAA